jgi:hypothetical protein
MKHNNFGLWTTNVSIMLLIVARPQVIFDTPEFGGLWTIDEEGYNFRHEIAVNSAAGFPKPHAHYEVRYELESTAGERSIVRFQLRMD